MSIQPGQPWERPAGSPADATVDGDDVRLAEWAGAHPGSRVAFVPRASDLARALGLPDGMSGPGAHDLTIDTLHVAADGRDGLAVNLLALGTPPDRIRALSRRFACSVTIDGRPLHAGHVVAVVVASGQYLRGADVVPRGHPGDGRLEVQVYALRRGESGGLRRRLADGSHMPHPRIVQRSGRQVEIVAGRRQPLELDGHRRPAAASVTVTVVPGALTLVI